MKKKDIKNKRFPHYIVVYREMKENPLSASAEVKVLYAGDGRSFSNTTTDGDRNLVENMRKSCVPIVFREWHTPIIAGDLIKVWKNPHICEWGTVTDVKEANFGTEIFWKYARN